MKWITRKRPKIKRLACSCLIRRFNDQEAEIIYVPYGEVLTRAAELNGTPFDVPGVEFTHYQGQCTLNYFIKSFRSPICYTHAGGECARY